MAKPTISLCMIVRDEEEHLPCCLESVQGLVDEIIVVDTGSKDRTMKIARSFGAKLYEHPWEDDFSKARNISLSYATSDWILILDADETLERKDIPYIRRFLSLNNCEGLVFIVYSSLPSGTSRLPSIKLFRNHRGHHYQGIVHNQLVIKGLVLSTKARVYHIGYNLDEKGMQRKFERSINLLKNQIKNHPDDLYSRFQLSRLYRGYGYFDECIQEALTTLSLAQSNPRPGIENTLLMTKCDLAYAYYKKGEYQLGEQRCRQILAQKEDYLDVLVTLGYIYLNQERYEEGITVLKKFLVMREEIEKGQRFDPLMVDNIGLPDKAYLYIGEAYVLLSRIPEAIDSFKEALKYNPGNQDAYQDLIVCYQKEGKQEEVEKIVQEAISNEAANEAIYCQLGQIYKAQGNTSGAKEAFGKAVEIKEDYLPAHLFLIEIFLSENEIEKVPAHLRQVEGIDPRKAYPVYKVLGTKCLALGRYNEAIQAYQSLLSSHPRDEEARLNLARALLKLGRYQEAQNNYHYILQLNPGHSEARKFLNMLEG